MEAVAPQPVAAPAPVADPAVAEMRTASDEPSLLERMEPQAQPAVDDGLPPPAYQPAPQPAAEAARPAPGTPTPEALARLERLTGRAPGTMSNHVPGDARFETRRAPAPESEQERPRFGINTLINRMSGSAGDPVRHQPTLNREAAHPEMSEDQERIEIPAFLRRQAN